jgi:DNA-binding MarR family transcriptional regulator
MANPSVALVGNNLYLHFRPDGEFQDCRTCHCYALRRAARLVTQHYDRLLRPSGLRTTQFTLLVTLAEAGPMPMTRLAGRLGLERTSLTRNLKPLEARGWVVVEADADRRVRTVAVTPSGRGKARAALPLWRKAQAGAAAVSPLLLSAAG